MLNTPMEILPLFLQCKVLIDILVITVNKILKYFVYTALFLLEIFTNTAFSSGNSEILVQMLITHPNIKVNLRGQDGYTALIKASGQEKVSYTKMILNHPYTNVNLATYYGETALTHAIRY
jgi:hypothetical protein